MEGKLEVSMRNFNSIAMPAFSRQKSLVLPLIGRSLQSEAGRGTGHLAGGRGQLFGCCLVIVGIPTVEERKWVGVACNSQVSGIEGQPEFILGWNLSW